MNPRQKWLAAALVATLAAVFWPNSQEPGDNVVEAVKRPQGKGQGQVPVRAASRQAGEKPLDERTRLGEMQADLFPSQTWVPPPPPVKAYKPLPPPPPKPPPLPFSYLGRWNDGGVETVFVRQGEQPMALKIGQVLNGSWRVDEISRSGVVFTYLPLNMQSTLGITQ